jgi:hypothetical protein
MKSFWATIVVVSVGLGFQPRAATCRTLCSCGWEHDPIKARDGSDLVIDGLALDSTLSAPLVRRGNYQFKLYQVRVVVRAVWKGSARDTIQVFTTDPGGGCGFYFVAGQSYLLFLHRDPAGTLFATMCSLSRARVGADSLVAALGPPIQ